MDDAMERLARAVLRRAPDVAHDLKTPLNIVVLNVELLRMRLRSLSDELAADSKIEEHCRALERESRRIAALADAFLSVAQVPDDDGPEPLEAAATLAFGLREESFPVSEPVPSCRVRTYRSRIDKTARTVASGLAAALRPEECSVGFSLQEGRLTIAVEGPFRDANTDSGKLFRFDYVDASDEPNPSLAAARLLLETIGGSIELEEHDGIGRFVLELQGDP